MGGFLVRWLCAFVLLAATYNSTSYNYASWVMSDGRENLSIAVLSGLFLIIGYIIYLRATMRSIGVIGMVLVLAVAGSLLWVVYDLGWINFENPTANIWVALFIMSFVLGIGLSWSHVRRRLSGQSDMDDVAD